MSEKPKRPKATVIGNPENYPRVFFGESEVGFLVSDVDFGIDYISPYVTIRVPVSGWELRPVD